MVETQSLQTEGHTDNLHYDIIRLIFSKKQLSGIQKSNQATNEKVCMCKGPLPEDT